MLHLRDLAERVDYWPFVSRLESNLLLYSLARQHFSDNYTRILKLRQPPFVKLIVSNAYPRTTVTSRLSGSDAIHYGPFRSRMAAESFEAGFLDFFQIRRCQEDLLPSIEHPGCVYGEMNRCLRPCQLVVSDAEYQTESERVAQFLRSNGQTLIDTTQHARERASEALEFEEAARLHKRLEKVQSVIHSRDELATEVTQLNGVAIVPALEKDAVVLWFFHKGIWLPGVTLNLRADESKPEPLDRKVRQIAASLQSPKRIALKDRQEHLALLAAWYYSSWRDGEWVPFTELTNLPYRKLVNAIHRVAVGNAEVS